MLLYNSRLFRTYLISIMLIIALENCADKKDKKEVSKSTLDKISIENTRWKFHVYRYYNSSQPDSGQFECKDINRYLIFKPNGILENEYFNDSTKSFSKTYGTYRYNDTMFEAAFYRDPIWKYRNGKDSIRLVGKICDISETYLYICTKKYIKKNGLDFLLLINAELN